MITTILATLKPFLIKGANVAWENRNQLMLYLKTKFWKYRNVDIRFSISGLYKIKIPDTNKYVSLKQKN
jgi:hypothetical protein